MNVEPNAQIDRKCIIGTSLSGKTQYLLTAFQTWSQKAVLSKDLPSTDLSSNKSSLNLDRFEHWVQRSFEYTLLFRNENLIIQ